MKRSKKNREVGRGERMSEGYPTWGPMRSVIRTSGI